jgi:hypothetical protein
MPLVRQVESKTKLRVPNYQSVAVYQLTEAGWRWGLGMSCMLYSLCANNRIIEVFAFEVHILTQKDKIPFQKITRLYSSLYYIQSVYKSGR